MKGWINERIVMLKICEQYKYSKLGFTLAEVLITLGIIGVVAALTLPALIQTNKNAEVEVKLKKVYSVMNQAILMSENVNGPKEYWTFETSGEFMDKYILPYLAKGYRMERFMGAGGLMGASVENILLYFPDGSALAGKRGSSAATLTTYTMDFSFFPNAKNWNESTYVLKKEDGSFSTERPDSGITYFGFRFAPASADPLDKYHVKKGFEPYMWGLETLDKEELTETGRYPCSKGSRNRNYCTVYIMQNNWKIPKDYPLKVK